MPPKILPIVIGRLGSEVESLKKMPLDKGNNEPKSPDSHLATITRVVGTGTSMVESTILFRVKVLVNWSRASLSCAIVAGTIIAPSRVRVGRSQGHEGKGKGGGSEDRICIYTVPSVSTELSVGMGVYWDIAT